MQPFNISVLQAKNELTHAVKTIGIKYDLPGIVIDLILAEILADERQAHLALMSEQYAQRGEEKQNADTRSKHEGTD